MKERDNYYSVVQKKVTALLSTSLAWPAWAGCGWAELYSEPGTNLYAQPCTLTVCNVRVCNVKICNIKKSLLTL